MRKNILVVDDSKPVRESIRYILEENKYDVIEGFDGLNGLEKLSEGDIDLIITDLRMPKLDGIGLIKKVRAHDKYKSIPILVLTVESEQEIIDEGTAAGADGWIVKPFSIDKLISAVQKVI